MSTQPTIHAVGAVGAPRTNSFKDRKLPVFAPKEVHSHSAFENVSAKDFEFVEVDFSFSNFDRAYFHGARFRKCKFVGCRFIQTNFRRATFSGCDFGYSFFTQTHIDPDQIIENLPPESNIRRELLQVLRANAESLGNYEAQKRFIRHELAAEMDHWRQVRYPRQDYYKSKFPGAANRLVGGWKTFVLWLDWHVWGYGEYPLKMFISFSTALLLTILYVVCSKFDLLVMSGNEILRATKVAGQHVVFSFLDVTFAREIQGMELIDAWLATLRYAGLALMFSALYRHLSHR